MPFQPEKETVKKRRGRKITQSDDIIFNGEFWSGQTAVDYGLVDGLDNLHSFIKHKYGDEVKVEYIEQKQSWFKKRFMSSATDTKMLTDSRLIAWQKS